MMQTTPTMGNQMMPICPMMMGGAGGTVTMVGM